MARKKLKVSNAERAQVKPVKEPEPKKKTKSRKQAFLDQLGYTKEYIAKILMNNRERKIVDDASKAINNIVSRYPYDPEGVEFPKYESIIERFAERVLENISENDIEESWLIQPAMQYKEMIVHEVSKRLRVETQGATDSIVSKIF